MTRSKDHRGAPHAPHAARPGHSGPREAFESWLTRDLRRQYGQPVQSPMPPELEAAVKELLAKNDEHD